MHWLAVLAVSLLALLAAADSHGDDSNPVVLIVGDSISAGLGVPVDKQWPLILEQKLQVEFPQLTVAVAAISGDTTSSGRGRLPSLLTTHAPTVTILALGGNDALRGTPLTLVKNNLITMIDAAKNNNSEVALAGMQIPPNYGPTYTEGFRQMYIDLAEEYDLGLIPFLLEGVATVDGMMQSDGIHPTTDAQPVLADNVAPVITSLLQE
jgi:acyl-CoA thioesterase-1